MKVRMGREPQETLAMLLSLAEGETQLQNRWFQLPWNLLPVADRQHSTETTQKAQNQVQPEQRESLQAWAASPVLWDSSWCVGKRQGKRLGPKNNVHNLATCAVALPNTGQNLLERVSLGIDHGPNLWPLYSKQSLAAILWHRHVTFIRKSSSLWSESRFLMIFRLLGIFGYIIFPNS